MTTERIPPLSRDEILALQNITFSDMQSSIANDLQISLTSKGLVTRGLDGLVATPNGKLAASLNSRRFFA